MKNMLFCTFFFMLAAGNMTAQSLNRSIALFDLTERNSESSDGRAFSTEHILKVAGIPFDFVNDINEAMGYALIVCSSYIDQNTLSTAEKNSLEDYVFNGGILIAPRISDPEILNLFGISSFSESTTNYLVNWNKNLATPIFRWIDEPEEWTISLGATNSGDIFKTYSYGLAHAISLAEYGNGDFAVTQNQFGSGFAYSFGFSWKDVILRSLINRDHEAQRISSNGFEPSMDVIMLMIRAIFTHHIPFSVWKHTSFNNSSSTMMITHDIDTSSALDDMLLFASSENNLGISATYNMTVRYFSDALESAFYYGSTPKLNQLIAKGHSIGAHSVGHFPDFGDSNLFPMGSPGNTPSNYLPSNDGVVTTGGTVYGECEVSKNLLESDLGIDIRIFRTGHLVYNNYLVDVLDDLGYLYNSSYSANEVLTNFPFQNKKGRSFSGDNSNVYELPVSISDVYHEDPITIDNYLEKADSWLNIIAKINANNAPTVLLIHPNRDFKLDAQEYLIAHLPQSIAIQEMGVFGDYWRAREAYSFASLLSENKLTITIPEESLSLNKNISLIVNNGQALDQIILKNEWNALINFSSENWENNDIVVYNIGLLDVSDSSLPFYTPMKFNIYPNPGNEKLYIEMNLHEVSNIRIELLDMFGKIMKVKEAAALGSGRQIIPLNLNDLLLSSGMYFCRIIVNENSHFIEKVLINR